MKSLNRKMLIKTFNLVYILFLFVFAVKLINNYQDLAEETNISLKEEINISVKKTPFDNVNISVMIEYFAKLLIEEDTLQYQILYLIGWIINILAIVYTLNESKEKLIMKIGII